MKSWKIFSRVLIITCTTLIDDHILDSFGILSLVSEIEDAFDVEVSPAELVPDNFNSAERLMAMINRLKGEQ